ncbi:hypothetical protein HGM15179_008640 [Zosterops borbonicus]|uniref:Uncharacterized protein n=1 Tax=Zosterops borbonicus TaxID=364589 RepID=A0A8K1GJ29_9PASS|nr:hypothetical protein HGM15179_008640 [Zosterops borbonicus]
MKEDLANSLGGNIVTKDEDKAEAPNTFFASVFKRTGGPQNNWPPELADRDGEQNSPPVIQEEAVSELLRHLDAHKSMGTDRIHPRVKRELVEDLTKPLSIIYQQSWLTKEANLDNVMLMHKKSWKEDQQNKDPDKVMEKIILSATPQHLQDDKDIRPSQHGFRRGRFLMFDKPGPLL